MRSHMLTFQRSCSCHFIPQRLHPGSQLFVRLRLPVSSRDVQSVLRVTSHCDRPLATVGEQPAQRVCDRGQFSGVVRSYFRP